MKKKKEILETEEKKINIHSLKDIPGLGPVSSERLAEKGITNMLSLWAGMNNPIEIAKITGMDKKDANKALIFVREQLEKAGVLGTTKMTADKYYDEILERKHLKLGCSNIDNILKGGFETSLLYELYGDGGAGKTQFLHTLAVNVSRPIEDGGLYDKETDGEKLPFTLYIDTENTFSPQRLQSIYAGKGLVTQIPKELQKKEIEDKLTDVELMELNKLKQKQFTESKELEKRILIWKCTTAVSLIVMLEDANGLISTGFPIKLIILDSLTNLFRPNYIGRGAMWSKSDDLNYVMKLLNDLAEVHKLVLIFTTQVYARPDAKQWEDPFIAHGGHIVAHASNVRLKLDKPSGNPMAKKHKMTIIKASYLPNDEALFTLTDKGVENFTKEEK